MGVGDRKGSSLSQILPETAPVSGSSNRARRGAWRAPSTGSAISVRWGRSGGRKGRTPCAPTKCRSGSFALRLVVVFLILVSIPAPSRAAELHHAAVIVHHGNGGVTYSYVAFAEDEIDGAELLKRADLDAVTISFGGLGDGVCM